jgi:hypothetical protein
LFQGSQCTWTQKHVDANAVWRKSISAQTALAQRHLVPSGRKLKDPSSQEHVVPTILLIKRTSIPWQAGREEHVDAMALCPECVLVRGVLCPRGTSWPQNIVAQVHLLWPETTSHQGLFNARARAQCNLAEEDSSSRTLQPNRKLLQFRSSWLKSAVAKRNLDTRALRLKNFGPRAPPARA